MFKFIRKLLVSIGRRNSTEQTPVTTDKQPKHFFEYLNPANASVIPGLEKFEVVYAKNQPEYIPLRTLRSCTHEGKVMSRWTLTPEQRKAVADGADIFLTLLTFGHPLQPIVMAVSDNSNPDYIRHDFNLLTAEEGWHKAAHEISDAQKTN